MPPGVFRPRSDTVLLAGHIRRAVRPGSHVLDLCTGSGMLAIAAARGGAAEVTATDISRRAVLAARLNGLLNGVRVRAVRGDLFEPAHGRRFDLIVSNPPYLPSARDELPRRGPARAWEGGHDGRRILDRLIGEAPAHLRPGGAVILVHSSVCGIATTLDAFARVGLAARVVDRERGTLGPLLEGRKALLERRGLLRPGAHEEEIVVISASVPARRSAADENQLESSRP